jgi:hypothetical protein
MSVLYDCYALHQYGSILCNHLTTDVFVELSHDGPVRIETTKIHQLLRVASVYLSKYCFVDGQTFTL